MGALLLVRAKRFATAFIASGTMVAGTITTAAVALFPFLMTSSTNPAHSLTVFCAPECQVYPFKAQQCFRESQPTFFLPASAVFSMRIRHARSSALNIDQSNATCQLPNTKGNKAISPVTMI